MGEISHIQVMSKEAEEFLAWEEGHARVIENDELVNALVEGLREERFRDKVEWVEG